TSTYKVSSSNNICCANASVMVTVETVSANCDGSIYCYGCSGKEVHVTPFDPVHYGYQWYENGIAIAGATGGSYSITVAAPQSMKQATVYCAVNKSDGTCAPG